MSKHQSLSIVLAVFLAASTVSPAAGQAQDDPGWWLTPHRLLQTNLREIDATMDTDQYVREVREFGANIVLFNVGGIVASFPWQIGAMDREWGNLGHPMLAVGALDNLLATDRRVKVGTSPLVEITHRRDPQKRFEWIALYNHSGRLEKSFHPPIPIHNIAVNLKALRPIKQISSLTNQATLSWTEKGKGQQQIILPELKVFDIVLVEYE